MELIVDLHVHSHFSRATSRNCNLEGLYYWGKLKGINIIGTGDFTHPAWLAELRHKLEPAEPGLFKLKSSIANELDKDLPESVRSNLIRFVPTVEISAIFSKGGKVRKLHQLVVMPDFNGVGELNIRLERIGNVTADGRPILGIDAKDLLRHSLESNPDSLFIPAHIWTPWFGMFGSKSGFDSIEEAFEELSPYIRAVETGLSSDPAMNWRVANLDGLTLTSNSDAHSPQKLGREATVVQSNLSYADIIGGFKTNDDRIVGTIEFFPEEGKYHADGHRVCGVRLNPEQTRQLSGICPQCARPLVVGVDYRVSELASRPAGFMPRQPKQVEYTIPLPEIIAELKGVKSVQSKTVTEECKRIYSALGDEFTVLRKLPVEEIRQAGFGLLALAIERMRAKNVVLEPGYDGVFGVVKVFKDLEERQAASSQLGVL